jgi:beta-glucanase (GH16 family)
MRRSLLNASFPILLALCLNCSKKTPDTTGNNSSTTTVPPPPSTPKTYQLVWSDEFNGDHLDTTVWNYEMGGNGWGNRELEYYQPSNATVSNGNLIITARKERVGSNIYTSARITTQGKKEFTYGRIEARIKIPVAMGLWPAFWMLGSDINTVSWPQCGETDIMEHINNDSLIYGTIHWNNNGHTSSGGHTASSPSDYHIYDVEWDNNTIKWHVDGVQYWEANVNGSNGTESFHNPFFILFNLAVGGNWPGFTVDESSMPASMYVDYVRVYQLK